MNKKNIIIISVVAILVIVIGILGFSKYEEGKTQKVINKGIEYLNKKEYEKAITTFDLVLDEKSNNEEALRLKGMINKYLEAKKSYDSGDIENSKKLIEEIGEGDSNYKEFKSDVDNLKKKIDIDIKKTKEIDNNIKKIRSLINDKKYSEAKNIIDKLEKDKLSDTQKQQISDLKGRVKSELDKQKLDEKVKEEKANQENKKQNMNSNKNKICDMSDGTLRSQGAVNAYNIARKYASDMECFSALGITDIPDQNKEGWGFVATDPGEAYIFVDEYGKVYVQVAGDTTARQQN